MTKERISRLSLSQETTTPDTRHATPDTRPPLLRTLAVLAFAFAGFAHGMAARGGAGEVRLAENGKALTVIVAPSEMMEWDTIDDDQLSEYMQRVFEQRRQLQRDSVLDLAHYLGKMIGAEVDIVSALPAGDQRTPLYIGATAEERFGPVGEAGGQPHAFRVVVDSRRGIGLYGESKYGVSYAIYELLHRLGCRWFMPSEMGEVVPDEPDLTVAVMDESRAPATEWRGFQGRTGDADFRRRNRISLSVDHLWQRHMLENYLSSEQLEENPEWYLHNEDGEIRTSAQRRNRFRWTREDVAHAVADEVIRRLGANYQPSMSLSPGDYVRYTEDPEERKHDPEPRVWEPAAGRWSVTDRLYMLANRVAERVGEKYPDVLFGLYAYVNYNMPPGRERVHPNVIPILAPIDFNRHHPMTWENHPNEFWLRDMIEGWSKKADRIGYYAYGMNLAELSAPNPFITKWGTDIPIIIENNLAVWSPETMTGWESMMPGYYLAFRMTFDPTETPEAILDDLWTRFYGAAAEPMAAYWHHIDRAWIEAEEYSGCGFGYLRMFTPGVMQQARALINEALAVCETPMELRRVQLIDETFGLFELFMQMREDFAAGRLRDLEDDLNRWRYTLRHLRERYGDQYVLSYRTAQGISMAEHYVNVFFGRPYEGASHMEETYRRHGAPMLEWQWKHNPDTEEASRPWVQPDYDDGDWPSKHVIRDTWSTIGHHNTLTDQAADESGRMVYRASQELGALPDGKRAWLWIGSTDGSAMLFVNGQHVPYVVPEGERHAGEVRDRFSGYCRPAKFEVTEHLEPGENHFAIKAERVHLNELGTGGLMGPVVVYREQ